MIVKNDRVKFILKEKKILSESMTSWINRHKNEVFIVEKLINKSVKLYKVDFWVNIDL